MWVALSLLLHLTLLSLAVLHHHEVQEALETRENRPTSKDKGDIAPAPAKTIEIVLEESLEGLDKLRHKPRTVKAPDCKDHHWYGGVGVRHSGGSNTYVQITGCPPGYPAYDAGVRVNDILLNPNDLRGKLGTPVTIIVDRRGETMVFKTKRAKICTED